MLASGREDYDVIFVLPPGSSRLWKQYTSEHVAAMAGRGCVAFTARTRRQESKCPRDTDVTLRSVAPRT